MIQRPFLKWVGGKTQLIANISTYFPNEINNYHEIFLGGGSVLFALLSLQKQNKIKINGKIMAYDVNEKLINVYKNIQSNKDEVFHYIQLYINEYDSISGTNGTKNPKTHYDALTSKESYYYWLRNLFNKTHPDNPECSALFIIMNKLCFRGMYREGPNGFNVPFGHYKKTPSIITYDELHVISDLIKNVDFICCDFRISIKNIEPDDYVYFDPPYVPLNKLSFVGYTKCGFDLKTHEELFNEIIKLNNNGIKFLLSNSCEKMVLEYFKDFNITKIVARRAIHSRDPSSTTIEVLINN